MTWTTFDTPSNFEDVVGFFPNGDIEVAGLGIVSQTCKLNNVTVNGFRFDKQRGAGCPLTVTNDGATVQFVFSNGAWQYAA
jgi:hypothetical protein